jgi:hypothetical protein
MLRVCWTFPDWKLARKPWIEPFHALQILRKVVQSQKTMGTQRNIIFRGDEPDMLMVKQTLLRFGALLRIF